MKKFQPGKEVLYLDYVHNLNFSSIGSKTMKENEMQKPANCMQVQWKSLITNLKGSTILLLVISEASDMKLKDD